MDSTPHQPVKVLSYKTGKVKIELVPGGKNLEMSKRFFERRLDMGYYEVINKEALPTI